MRKHLSLLLVFTIFGSALMSCTTTTTPRIPRSRIQTDAREPLPPVWNREANSVYAQSRSNGLIGPDGQKVPRSVRRMQALEAKQRRAMIDAPAEKKPTWREKRLAAARDRAEAEAAALAQAETSFQTRRTTTTSRPPSSSSRETNNSNDFVLAPEFETSFSPATFDPADAIEETASTEAPEAPESTALVPTDLPFAVPIPGKDGYVTLPRGNSYRGEIDVRGIGSGTPVEIPDPNSPGQTVQFRVP